MCLYFCLSVASPLSLPFPISPSVYLSLSFISLPLYLSPSLFSLSLSPFSNYSFSLPSPSLALFSLSPLSLPLYLFFLSAFSIPPSIPLTPSIYLSPLSLSHSPSPFSHPLSPSPLCLPLLPLFYIALPPLLSHSPYDSLSLSISLHLSPRSLSLSLSLSLSCFIPKYWVKITNLSSNTARYP